MKVVEKGEGGPRTQAERADSALAGTYTRGVDRSGSRDWKSQSLLALAICATFVGVWLTMFGSPVGIGLLVVGLPTAIATTVWCIRNWDY
jgi:hypothetical protein